MKRFYKILLLFCGLVTARPIAAQIVGQSSDVEEKLHAQLVTYRKGHFQSLYEKLLSERLDQLAGGSTLSYESLALAKTGARYIDSHPLLAYQYCNLAGSKLDADGGGSPDAISVYLREFLSFCLAKVYTQKEDYSGALDLMSDLKKWRFKGELKVLAYELKLRILWKKDDLTNYLTEFATYQKLQRSANQDEELVSYAAQANYKLGRYKAYFEDLEQLAKSYPLNATSAWALDLLQAHADPKAPKDKQRYYFSLELLRTINRNFLGPHPFKAQLSSILAIKVKTHSKNIKLLTPTEKVSAFAYIRAYEEARALADDLLIKHAGAGLTAPQRMETWAMLGWVDSMLGDYVAAADAYSKALGLHLGNKKSDDNVVRNYADSLSRAGKYHEAAEHFHQLARRVHDKVLKWSYFWNLYLAKDYAEAEKLIGEAGYIPVWDDQDPMGHSYWHARILLHEGSNEIGSSQLKTIARNYPVSYYGIMALERFNRMDKSEVVTLQPHKGAYPTPYDDIVEAAAADAGIDKYLLLSIMKVESAFRPDIESYVGARGLMQIMPYTAIRIARLLGDKRFSLHELEEPTINVVYGAYYLQRLLTYYRGNYILAIAAYNAGPFAVRKWLATCHECETDEFVDLIGYVETRNYVKKVLRFYAAYRFLYAGKKIMDDLPARPSTDQFSNDFIIF